MTITKDIRIGELVMLSEHIEPILTRIGMHCLG